MGRLMVQLISDLDEKKTLESGKALIPISTLQGEYQTNAWDEAHRAVLDPSKTTLESGKNVGYAEPDFIQSFLHTKKTFALESSRKEVECGFANPDPYWPSHESFAWHLNFDYSQLRRARNYVGDKGDVTIGILDTGYDPSHSTCPKKILKELERNFVDESNPYDARDPVVTGSFKNPGHGTATLAILAGKKIQPDQISNFDDYLGGSPYAKIIPIRIANSVVHFYTSAMVKGINYAVDKGCNVISISMGGLPSKAWANAVNRAYEEGVIICAAAGNRYGISPPTEIIYPARFRRVVAVCGATANKTPYYKTDNYTEMQGCFGPTSKMDTAIAAYTPNMPWAKINCSNLVNLDGAGTSSATPQIAATAALWLQKHQPNPSERWKIVEAFRNALFSTADKSQPDSERFFGQGILRAFDAVKTPYRDDLTQQPKDTVSFPWIDDILGGLEKGRQYMYEVEALQVFEQSHRLKQIADGADPLTDELDKSTKKRLFEEMQQLSITSQTLKKHLTNILKNL